MTKIVDLFRRRKTAGDVGIEIEVEGENLVIVDNEVWSTVDDHSLRGVYPESRAEYVLATPVRSDAILPALNMLAEELANSKLDFSYRTSVHVHVNVQQLEAEELLSMMYLYYLLEEPLTRYAGMARIGNNFCLRLRDAEGVLNFTKPWFIDPEKMAGYQAHDRVRYAAMNLEALPKYGSVEFRAMEGNLDVERIQDWCKMLLCLRDHKLGSVIDISNAFGLFGPLGLLEEVFPPKLLKKLMFSDVEYKMNESFSLSYDLVSSYAYGVSKRAKEAEELKNFKPKYKAKQMLTYEQAVDCNSLGGEVKEQRQNMYVVVRPDTMSSPKPRYPAKDVEIALEFAGDIKVEW